MLVGPEGDERLPSLVERVPERHLAARCDIVLALGDDGTVLGAMRLAPPTRFPDGARRKLGIVDPVHLADYDLAGHER